MREAIQKAIEGGYGDGREEWLIKLPDYAKAQIWLDPLFWQCLGKAMGWYEGEIIPKYWYRNTKEKIKTAPRWKKEWHRFIDHLIGGEDADSFFNNLIETK